MTIQPWICYSRIPGVTSLVYSYRRFQACSLLDAANQYRKIGIHEFLWAEPYANLPPGYKLDREGIERRLCLRLTGGLKTPTPDAVIGPRKKVPELTLEVYREKAIDTDAAMAAVRALSKGA